MSSAVVLGNTSSATAIPQIKSGPPAHSVNSNHGTLFCVIYKQNAGAGKDIGSSPSLPNRLVPRASRQDVDRSPVGDSVPDFDDRGIADRDASVGPVALPTRRIVRAKVAWQAVDKDPAAGFDMRRLRPSAVLRVWIGDVEFARVPRVLRAPINAIDAFGCTPIARLALGASRVRAE